MWSVTLLLVTKLLATPWANSNMYYIIATLQGYKEESPYRLKFCRQPASRLDVVRNVVSSEGKLCVDVLGSFRFFWWPFQSVNLNTYTVSGPILASWLPLNDKHHHIIILQLALIMMLVYCTRKTRVVSCVGYFLTKFLLFLAQTQIMQFMDFSLYSVWQMCQFKLLKS